MSQENHHQIQKDFEQFNELCAALGSLQDLIFSDFFKTLSKNTQQKILGDYASKLKFKSLINEEVLIDESEIIKNKKYISQFKKQFPDDFFDIDITPPPKISKSTEIFQWCLDNLFFYNQYRLKNIYPMALEEGMIKTLNYNAPILSDFNKTTATISAGSSPFINITRSCQEWLDIIGISIKHSEYISTSDKLIVLFKQRYKRLINDIYLGILNSLSFFEFRSHVQIKDMLSAIGLSFDVLLSISELYITNSYHQQIEQEILNHIESIRKRTSSQDSYQIDDKLQLEVKEFISVYHYIKTQHQKKLQKIYIELYLNIALLIAFFILSGFFGLFPDSSSNTRHLLLLIGAILAVIIQISSTILDNQAEQNAETSLEKIRALQLKMYSDIFAHCLFPSLSLITNLVIRPTIGIELPNLFVLLSLMGLSKVIIDLVNSISFYYQQKHVSQENSLSLHEIQINAIKAFAMIELIGLIAWSEYTPIITGLSFNPILLSAIAVFVALHLYAHIHKDNNDYQLLVEKKSI